MFSYAVVGWETQQLEVTEGDRGVSVQVRLVKGDPAILPPAIRFTPMEDTGTATSTSNLLFVIPR